MYPINQVIVGSDPMMSSIDNLDNQMQMYQQRLAQLQAAKQVQVKLIWDDIDAEVSPLSNEQKERLFQDEEYRDSYTELQNIVQAELLNLVKSKIESTDKGKELLNNQLKLIRKLKSKIISDTNREMELFMRFREYSKANPNSTYEEFLKKEI